MNPPFICVPNFASQYNAGKSCSVAVGVANIEFLLKEGTKKNAGYIPRELSTTNATLHYETIGEGRMLLKFDFINGYTMGYIIVEIASIEYSPESSFEKDSELNFLIEGKLRGLLNIKFHGDRLKGEIRQIEIERIALDVSKTR